MALVKGTDTRFKKSEIFLSLAPFAIHQIHIAGIITKPPKVDKGKMIIPIPANFRP